MPRSVLAPSMAALAARLGRLAILLDVDGTILDLAPTPQAVRVPPRLREVLQRLRAQTGGAIALVSGRPVAALDRLFAPLRLPAIGGHGAELRPALDMDEPCSVSAPLDSRLKRELTAIAEGKFGILVEDKGYALALHYRLAPEQETQVRASAALICADFDPGVIEFLPGKAMVEVKPAGINKGAAVTALMKHAPFSGRRPVYIGDDITDESAFTSIVRLGGIAMSVGRKHPAASHCFDQPEDVRHWLQALSAAAQAPVQ